MHIETNRVFLSQISTDCPDDEPMRTRLARLLRMVPNALGIAAIQLGIPTRAFLANDIVYFNPVMTSCEGSQTSVESCLSVGGPFEMQRYDRIVVEAEREDGTSFTAVLEGAPAVVFQHEYDHLNGICIGQ